MGTADKNYYLDDNGKVTTDEEKAAVVLINKGQDIPKEMAEKYGIGKGKKSAEAEGDSAEAASDDAGEKASGPKSNKAASPKKNKQS